MRIIYDIGIRLYQLSAWVLSLWNRKAWLWVRGRRGWRKALKVAFGPADRVVWFHCSSLGEFEQGRPLIEAFRQRCPEHKVLLTFFSPSGYEKRKTYPGADHVMYLPLDTARNARTLVNTVPLEMVLFIKYEFWYHYLRQLKRKGIPVYLASGIFRPGQIFFKWYGAWYRGFLDRFTHIFVQQEASRELLLAYGIRHVTLAGDTRFDRVRQVAGTAYNHPALEEFTTGYRVIIAGSTWEPDEKLLEETFLELPSDVKWIIAPHEVTDTHLKSLKERFPGSLLFTEAKGDIPSTTRVVIVDTIGQLSYLYRFGTVAYIGGGFGKGIHNLLEAATYGIPVIFGPNHGRFPEALDLVRIGAAFPVSGREELFSTLTKLFEMNSLLKTASRAASKYVLERIGATSAIVDKVCINPEG
jgi:3-deoxy-D-manno-octulosonic-acid transferase